MLQPTGSITAEEGLCCTVLVVVAADGWSVNLEREEIWVRSFFDWSYLLPPPSLTVARIDNYDR